MDTPDPKVTGQVTQSRWQDDESPSPSRWYCIPEEIDQTLVLFTHDTIMTGDTSQSSSRWEHDLSGYTIAIARRRRPVEHANVISVAFRRPRHATSRVKHVTCHVAQSR